MIWKQAIDVAEDLAVVLQTSQYEILQELPSLIHQICHTDTNVEFYMPENISIYK